MKTDGSRLQMRRSSIKQEEAQERVLFLSHFLVPLSPKCITKSVGYFSCQASARLLSPFLC